MRIARYLLRYRWWVVACLSALTLAGAALAPSLQFDFTPQAVFEGNDDLLHRDEEFKRVFGYQDAVLLVVLEATGGDDVLGEAALAWQVRAAGQLQALTHVQRAEAMVLLQVPRRIPGVGLAVGSQPLVPAALTADTRGRINEQLAHLPLVDGELISRDRRATKIVLFADADCREAARMRDLIARVKAALARSPLPAGYAVHLSGLPALRMDIVQGLREDLFFLLPVAGGLFLIILLGEFRRLGAALLPLAAVGAGLAWTVGLFVLCGQELNIVSNVLPVMLFVIGMANCVHMVSRYGEEIARTPRRPIGAARRTVRFMLLACLLTSLTTMVGFASLLAAHSAVLQALGLHAVIGVGLLYVSTITVLGTLLPSVRPPRQDRGTLQDHHLHPVARLVGWAGHLIARNPRRTLAGGAVVVATALALARGAVVNSYMMETYDESHPGIKTLRLVERQLSGILPLEISLEADSDQAFLGGDAFERAVRAEAFAAGQDGVVSTRSYADVLREVYAGLTGQSYAAVVLGGPTAGGQARLTLAGQIARRTANLVHPEMFLSADGRRARILLRVRDIGSRRMLAMIAALEKRLGEIFPPHLGVRACLTGDSYVHAKAMDRFVRDLFWSLVSATVVIFCVIALLFWSLRVGLIAVLPNLAPLLVVLGYIALRGYELNAGNVVVFAVSIGIAVDNTIHFLARFREEIRVDGDVLQSIRRSFQSAGRAVVLATFLIVAGLSVLLFSRFVPSRRFAELTGVTLLSALLGNLLLLPACLVLFWKPHRGPARSIGIDSGPPSP